MDTSETYIKMCEKAEEIQKQRYSKDLYDGKSFFADSETSVFIESYGVNIWLPRQDQLQEMIFCTEGTYDKLPTKVFAFSDYWEENGIPIMFNSLHQLWLAFVMKEKYSKTWDGENWT